MTTTLHGDVPSLSVRARDACTCLVLGCWGLPYQFAGSFFIMGAYYLYWLEGLLVVIGLLWASRRRDLTAPSISVIYIAGVYMFLLGKLNRSYMRFAVDSRGLILDSLIYFGFVLGFSVGASEGWSNCRVLIRRMFKIAVVLLSLINLGIVVGVVAVIKGDRLVVYSAYTLTWFVSAAAPLVLAGYADARGRRANWSGYALILVGWSAVLISGLLSATRSVMIQALFSMLVCLLLFKGAKVHVKACALVLILISAVPVLEFVGMSNVDLFQARTYRPRGDQFRLVELETIREAAGTDLVWGTGFGSAFTIINEYTTNAPHIAITTPIIKGGLVGALAMLIIPLAIAARSLFKGHLRRYACFGALSSTACFWVFSSLSGGWAFVELWTYGMSVGLLWRDLRSGVPSLRAAPAMRWSGKQDVLIVQKGFNAVNTDRSLCGR